jgi:hypothetical protein
MMKKHWSLVLILAFLGLLLPGRALSSLGFTVQPALPASSQEVQAAYNVYLPVLTQTFPDRSIFGAEFAGTDTGLTDMKDAGAYWARLNAISWADIEPSPGVRSWGVLANFEQMVMDMHSRGLEVIAIIRETPTWAQAVPGSFCGPIQDEDIPAFADFVKEVVAKYSQAPYYVRHWEIENEMDVPVNTQTTVFGCWGDPGDEYYGGRYYAKVIQKVYPAVKAADPQSQVLLGGLLLDCNPNNPPIINGQAKDCSSGHYLEGVLVGGGGNFFDAVSFHAYDYYYEQLGAFGNPNFDSSQANQTVLMDKTAFLRGVLNKYGFGNKPLLNTEVALLCVNDCDADFELTKAYYLARAYADAIKAGLQANVWYTVAPSWRNTSLLSSDGSPNPAYEAYQFAHQMMSDATSISELSLNSSVHGYELRFPGKRVWLLWATLGQSSGIQLPAVPQGIYDTLGNFQGTSQSLVVDFRPVYVVLSP